MSLHDHFARFILSWVPSSPGDAIYDFTVFVNEITDPLCLPFQKLIPPLGGLDFSLIFVLIGIQMFESVVMSSLGADEYKIKTNRYSEYGFS